MKALFPPRARILVLCLAPVPTLTISSRRLPNCSPENLELRTHCPLFFPTLLPWLHFPRSDRLGRRALLFLLVPLFPVLSKGPAPGRRCLIPSRSGVYNYASPPQPFALMDTRSARLAPYAVQLCCSTEEDLSPSKFIVVPPSRMKAPPLSRRERSSPRIVFSSN